MITPSKKTTKTTTKKAVKVSSVITPLSVAEKENLSLSKKN